MYLVIEQLEYILKYELVCMEKTHRCFFPPSSDDIAVVTNLVNQNNRHLTTGSISITNVAISGNEKEKKL